MIEKKYIETPLGSKRSFFYDDTNLKEYRRIVGGLAWPSGDKPGFLCVVGEDDHKIPRLKTRAYWLLAEYKTNNVDKLVKRCYDLQNRFLISTWFSAVNDVIMMNFVDKFNSKLSKKKKAIYLSEAPFVGEPHSMKLYANQILGMTDPAKKTLYFGTNSSIPDVLLSLDPEQIKKQRVEEYPHIAALGYIISGLEEPYFDISSDYQLQQQYINSRMVSGL